ncbi:MAG: hypothetical protein JO332_17965, partial [Planctomycetaceae bacterium]|nr:hypothetical protein [Planctomycetaceae bacterium]
MKFGTYWIVAFIVTGLPSAVLVGTMIHDEDGDPWICKHCWIGGHHHHASEGAPWRLMNRVARGQRAYFADDPDAKGRKEYWRKDIAGLWANVGKDGYRIGY